MNRENEKFKRDEETIARNEDENFIELKFVIFFFFYRIANDGREAAFHLVW